MCEEEEKERRKEGRKERQRGREGKSESPWGGGGQATNGGIALDCTACWWMGGDAAHLVHLDF